MQNKKLEKETSNELLQKLAQMIDKINANYVSKDDLNKMLSHQKVKTEKTSIPDKKLSASEKHSKGIELYNQKKYNESMTLFLEIENSGYKPAATSFFLGENSYYLGKYEDAIYYYKKSAGLYDKADYMDKLLYHTGYSLEQTNKQEEAIPFYQMIIDSFPNSEYVSLSKKNLE